MAEVAYGIEELDRAIEGAGGAKEGVPGAGEGAEAGGEGGGEEGHPSIADIVTQGYPAEWLVLIGICSFLTLVMMIFFLKAVLAHKKYSTKHTMQFFSTIGILMVYPLYALMYVSGMVVPRANSKCTFIAETYESLSLMFFLKLMLTYMGGKKQAVKSLTGTHVHLNAPPLCWCPLPSVKFSSTFLFTNEIFVLQLIVLELVMGYIDLLMNMDQSKSYPAALVEETYSHVFHGMSIASLVLSVYGLSSIYHSAEKELKKYNIFKKFVCYKIVVTLAKVQDIIFSILSRNEVFGDLSNGAFTTHLRMHIWSSTLTILECSVIFPIALKAFPIMDYPSDPGSFEKETVGCPEKASMIPPEYENGKSNGISDLKDMVALRGEVDSSTTKTVLFLTDSLLSTFSSSKFTGGGLSCSKKGLNRLTDLKKYLPEFPYNDYVIVSAGISDVYKYRTPLDELIRFSVGFYEECARTCPRTKFVYMSLLQSGFEWVNNVSDDYNTYIFELSLRYPNLLFYDNFALVNRDILQEDGIHINDRAVKFIAKSLVKAVTNLSQCYNDPRDPWPLRPSFARKALAYKSGTFENA